jgi:alkanesulfonate monooxygenase SsuD/methylene tetrahydromethanopterin reductase-like flavin-dependent oxidoreductase (luciferase family)
VAQRTKRLRFGPLVYALPFYNPLRVVEEICMLDQMSGGRLEMGFGRGASPIEMSYYGLSPERAQSLYEEGLDLVLRALSQASLTVEGNAEGFREVPMELAPLQRPHPPIWYGAHSPESAARAAHRGLNIVNNDRPEIARAAFDSFRATWLSLHGTTRPMPKMGLNRFIVVADTDEAALAAAERAYPKWHRSFSYLFHKHGRSPMLGERADSFEAMRDVERKGVAGSPETVTAYLRQRIEETGATYLVGQFAFGDLTQTEMLRSVELFAQHVMPALRADAAAAAA